MTDGLVLIHAFPLDASMWGRQVQAFGDRLPVLAPNLPGFGGEPGAGDVMTMDVAADHVARRMGEAGIDRAVVVGLSMGGYVALALWRRHRERIAGLLFANTRAEPDDEAGRERRRGLAENVRTNGTQAVVDSPPPLLAADAPTELWDEVKAIIAAQPAQSIAAASLGIAERPDSRSDLAGIDVPTAVVTGSEDTLIPPDVTRGMAGAIGTELAVLDGAGHLTNMEAPEEFNRQLSELLDRAAS